MAPFSARASRGKVEPKQRPFEVNSDGLRTYSKPKSNEKQEKDEFYKLMETPGSRK